MMDRSPGEGRYAATEREQRWLMRQLPVGVSDPVEIVDKYLHSSTLRLRRARSGPTTLYKLGQKVRRDPSQPSLNQLTNLYLSQTEFLTLNALDGAVLSKRRWRWTVGGRVLSIDQFDGLLSGLVLAEVELPVNGDASSLPPGSAADVTADDRFSGGRLASLTRPQAEHLLEMVATMVDECRQK